MINVFVKGRVYVLKRRSMKPRWGVVVFIDA